jgi:hypothetical protein
MTVAELMARSEPRADEPVGHENALGVHALEPTPRRPNTDVTREKTVIKEREVITDGPSGRHKEKEVEDVLERDMVTGPGLGDARLTDVPVDAAGIPLPASQPSSAGARINPRTGKPLSIPKPLSLSPHQPSPVIPFPDVPVGSQLIREEHEEVRASNLRFQSLTPRSYRDRMVDHPSTPIRLLVHMYAPMEVTSM